MIRLAAIAASLCGLATPSFATEWVDCTDAGGEASFSYLAGALDTLQVVGLNISVRDKVWASDVAYGPGDPAVVGQAFETAETVMVDAVNPELTARIAELRLFKAGEGQSSVRAGTLRVPGLGAWAVSCTGP